MRYIADRAFVDRKGEQVRVPSVGSDGQVVVEAPTIGRLIWLLLNAYMPTREFSLSIAEMGRLYRVLDVLETPAAEGGFAFEDGDFEIMQKTVLSLIPQSLLLAKYSPLVANILSSAPTSLPKGN